MNNNVNVNIDLKFNDYGNPECFPDELNKINPEMKLKIDAVIKKVLSGLDIPLDQIQSICLNKTSTVIKFYIASLQKKEMIPLENSIEIMNLALDAFKEKDELPWKEIVFHVAQKSTQKATVLPNILKKANPVSQKILAHIHADEFGKESTLGGSNSIEMLRFLEKFLNDRYLETIPYGLSTEVLNQLFYAFTYDLALKNPNLITEKISDCLNSQTAMLMTGGWIGNPSGHAIYYELVPESNSKATFRLFNLGAGVKEIVTEEIKLKAAPVVEWQGVSFSNLLSPQFAKVLHELSQQKSIPNTQSPTDYEASDIYGALKELLNPEIENVIFSKENESITMTPQRGEMCCWKSLMPFLRTKMNETNYKIFKCDVKLQTLIDSYDHTDSTSELSQGAHWRLIHKSLASTSRSIDKLYESGVVGIEYVMKAHEYMLPVYQWIKENKATTLINHEICDVQKLQYQSPGKIHWSKGGDFEIETPLSLRKPGEDSLQKKGLLVEKMKTIPTPLKAGDIESTLNAVLPMAKQAWLDKNDSDNHLGLHQLISMLPIDEEFWINAANNVPKQAEDLILGLGELNALYFKTCWTVPSAELVMPERVLGMSKINYIMNHLIKIIAPELWHTIRPSLAFYRREFESRLFNPKANEEWEIISFWPSPERGVIEFSRPDFSECFKESINLNSNSFTDILRRIDPNFERTLRNTPINFNKKSKKSQNTYIWTSGNLQPWLKSVIDSALYVNCIAYENFYNPPLRNRDKNLTLESHVKEGGLLSYAVWSLNDVYVKNSKTSKKIYFQSDKLKCYFGLYKEAYEFLERWLLNDRIARDINKNQIISRLRSRAEREEFRELTYPLIGDGGPLIIPSTLAYFENHPERIFDVDCQCLFEIFMYDGVHNIQKKWELDEIKEKLICFLEANAEKSINNNQIQTIAFLARNSRYLERYFNDPRLQKLQLPLLRKVLESQNLDTNQKSVVYAEICANLSNKKILVQSDIEELLCGSAFICRYPIRKSWTNEYVRCDIANSLLMHASQLQEALVKDGVPNQQLLNHVLKKLSPEAKEEVWLMFTKEGEYPRFSTSTGSYEYYPWLGNLFSPGFEVILPEIITKTDQFEKLFPTVKKGLQLEGNIFAFKDAENIETCVTREENELIIEQFRGDPKQWYRLFPKEVLINKPYRVQPLTPIYSRHLTGHYDAWQDLNADPIKLLLVDPTTKQEKYICTFENNGRFSFKAKEIRRLSDNALLGAGSSMMNAFEDAACIHEWYIDGKLVEIELPRYSISFKTNAADATRVYCDKLPGFFLKPGEVLKTLGTYRHYLVLENDHGVKKALLPVHHFESVEKREVFEPRYTIQMNIEDNTSKPQQLQVFEVMKNGKLFAKSIEANLYLTEVLLLVQNYKQAAALLKNYGAKLRAYTPTEIELLKKISSMDTVTGNIEGNALGIQMYAFYLLEKNYRDFPKEVQQCKLAKKSTFKIHYERYLNHLNTIHELKLSKEEELYLIRASAPSEVINNRLKELTGVEKSYNELGYPTTENLNFKQLILGHSSLWNYKESLNKFSLASLTRGGTALVNTKFTALYELSRTNPSDEPSDYRTALIYWKHHTKNSNDRLKAILLMLVLDHKERFPSLSDVNEYNFDEWWSKVTDVASDVLKEFPPVKPIKKTTQIIPKTRTRRSQQSALKIPVRPFQLQSIAPFQRKEFVGTNQEAWFSIIEKPKGCELSSTSELGEKTSIRNILDQLIQISALENQKPDPLISKEVDRIKKNLIAYEKQSPKPYYQLNENALAEIEAFCTVMIESIEEGSHQNKIAALEKKILAIAREAPMTDFGKARKDLQTWGGMHKPLNIKELIVNFAKQDPTALKARNPALSMEDIKDIYEKIGVYLQLCTQLQQAQRSFATLNKLNALKKNPNADLDAIDELVQKLANDLNSKRSYALAENPAFLIFEYFASILLRPDQTELIFKFLKDRNFNAIRELIMGSGKSKVLMPLLALLRADGQYLSILIVPQPLFQSISADTQGILKEAFDTSLHTFEFDRNTNFDTETLSNIQEELESIKVNKEALIITSKSIQCLLLKFIEKAIEHFRDSSHPTEMTPQLKLMRQILGQLSTQSLPLLDEADLLLNVLHEVTFSLGQKNMPIRQESEVITAIYEILYNDPTIKKLARADSDPEGSLHAPILTEALYHSDVKRPLAEAFVAQMQTKTFEDKSLQKMINAHFNSLSPKDRNCLLDYLCRTKDKENASQEYYNQQSQEIREVLAMAGEEIGNLLSHTLSKPCDEKYGIDEAAEGLLAIPFSAAKTPSRGSEFANHHITINYTLQNYVKKGISRHLLNSQLRLLQEKARREIHDAGGDIELKETIAWESFCQIKGNLEIPLFNLNDQQFDLFFKEVNRNTSNRLKMVQHLILPQIIIFDRKISSNSHNLVSFFKILSGFTGTLWNSASMHRNVIPQPTEGTDALTMTKLWQNSYYAVHTISAGTPQEMMEQIKQKVGSFDLLADAGGYFKDNDNRNNAKLQSTLLKKPTVFYNEPGDQAIWDSKEVLFSESPLKEQEEQRSTFLDQAHTAGADVTQKTRARGVVTIGADMNLRDLFQASWRLRGVDKVDELEFIVLKDVEMIIRHTLKMESLPVEESTSAELITKKSSHLANSKTSSIPEKLTYAHILSFLIINQAKHQGRDNYKAYSDELNEISQKVLLDVLLNPHSTPQECAEIVEKLESTWIKPSFATADALYGQIPIQVDSNTVRKQLRDKAIKTAESLELHSTVNDIQEVSCRFKGSLPPTISTKIGNEDLTSEQEQQKIAEKQTELETFTAFETHGVEFGEILETDDLKTFTPDKFTPELYPTNIRGYTTNRFHFPPSSNPLPLFPLNLFFEAYQEFHPFIGCFEDIHISLGMLQIIDKKEVSLKDIAFFGPSRKEIKYMMIDKEKITLLNHAEAENRVKKKYKNIYELTIGYVNSKEKIDDKTAEKLTKIKFLAGKSNYTRQELNFLKLWIAKEGIKKMYNLFTKHILKGKVLKSQDYQQSSLQKLFQEWDMEAS